MNEKAKDGGPAFAYQEFIDPSVIGGPQRQRTVPGMSLRAYIATAALQGLLAGRHTSDVHGIRHDAYSADAPEWAKQSVVYADALLAELAK